MHFTFALVALLPFFAASLGAPLEKQGLARRHMFNYEPDLPITESKRGSDDKQATEVKGGGVDKLLSFFKRKDEAKDGPDRFFKRKDEAKDGLDGFFKCSDEGRILTFAERKPTAESF